MDNLQVSAQKDLKRLVEQIERLDEERKALCGDIKDKFSEAKSKGLDVKVLRKILKIRQQDPKDRAEEEAIIATYLHAVGYDLTPLGAYADRTEAREAAHV